MTAIIEDMINRARAAQETLDGYTQEQVDALVKAAGKVVHDQAEELAVATVEETRMGNVRDKILKNENKARNVWNFLKNKNSIGVIEPKNDDGMITVAKPVGVVGAVTPVTSPAMTIMCNVMFALKGGNAIIIAPHPGAKKTSQLTVNLIADEFAKLGAPQNLVQCIEQPSIPMTNELIASVDVIVATGGPAMVSAAYSSGKPSYGVGAGNVQTIIDSDVDFDQVAEKVIAGRIFDNGIICSGDQSIIVPKTQADQVVEAFQRKGAYYIDDQALADRLRNVLFENGYTAREVVGQSVQTIAERADLEIPENTRTLLIKSNGSAEDVLRSEKMCPVLALFEYETLDEAIEIAQTNLEVRGKGHTCVIHSNNEANIEKIGLSLPVSRIAINEPGSLSVGGSPKNGFIPTGTLGCGSWGNNSISENFNYKHMINTQRIGFTLHDRSIPTVEETWC